jgi:hypothetical protein
VEGLEGGSVGCRAEVPASPYDPYRCSDDQRCQDDDQQHRQQVRPGDGGSGGIGRSGCLGRSWRGWYDVVHR